jgi:ABC-type multidrug transport system ATPase subunit/ABC-type multidrug transport system permease subunit
MRVETKSIETDRIFINSSEAEDTVLSTPTIRVSLSWKDLCYSVTKGHKKLKIIKNVSGFANPGEILAVMGPSGSGKTTLLNMLSNQVFPQKKIKLSGSVELNGINIKNLDYTSYVRYAMQQDILLPTLTPREIITFSAQFRLDLNQEEIKDRVNRILEEFQIFNIADQFIGNEIIKGISGGEKRRVSIANELISDPNILILDEPTSGLDSSIALKIIKILKSHALRGKTIILTVHQPSASMFSEFSRLILMAEGHFVYQGQAKNSTEYFDRIGSVCENLVTPPDHFMRILSIKNKQNLTEEENTNLDLFIESYAELDIESECFYFNQIDPNYRCYRASFRSQLSILTQMSLINTLRNPLLMAVKLAQSIISGFISILVFGSLGKDDQGIRERAAILFCTLVVTIFFGLQNNAQSFPIERPFFLKNYKQNLYGVLPYYLSKQISELPVHIIFAIIYSLIQYFALNLNLNSAWNFSVYLLICFLTHLVGVAFGNLAGIISKNIVQATVIGPSFILPGGMFAGYITNINSLNSTFSWIKYTSPFNYGFEALVLNDFTGLKLDKTVKISPLVELGYEHGSISECIWCLIVLEIVLSIICVLVLKYVTESSKMKL